MNRVPPDTLCFPVLLQRNSFGPRLVARAGDVWRAMQDVVVDESSSVGWTPARFVAAGTMFVVRTMTVVHEREVRFGESLTGRTWPARARRDMLFTREVRLFASPNAARASELVASATQEWAYLSRDLVPIRAGRELFDAFTLVAGYPSVALDTTVEPIDGAPVSHLRFRTWHTWMDALAHLNHPAYVDFCDEGTAHAVAAAGLDPQRLVPLAEQVHFRAAIAADAEVSVETHLKGRLRDAAVLAHRIVIDGRLCATATTVRRLADDAGPTLGDALARRE